MEPLLSQIPLAELINQVWREGQMPAVRKQSPNDKGPRPGGTVRRAAEAAPGGYLDFDTQGTAAGVKYAHSAAGPFAGEEELDPSDIFDAATPVEKMSETGLKFLIFGISGTGKTTMACDFPKPLLLIRPEEVEDGSRSVRRVAGVSVTPPITTPDQIAEIAAGQARTGRYKTLVLDGVHRVQDLVVKKHMGFEDVPVQQTWGMVPQTDWNRIGITLKEYLRLLMRLAENGTNIVLVGGERKLSPKPRSATDMADLGGDVAVPQVMVSLTPGSIGFVHETCDYNIHTFKRGGMEEVVTEMAGENITTLTLTGRVEFCAHVGPSDYYATKFRTDRTVELPEIIVVGPKDSPYAIFRKLIDAGSYPAHTSSAAGGRKPRPSPR